MTKLARRARMSRTYVSLIVHGHRTNGESRWRIARALRMAVDEAFPESGKE